MLNGFKTGGAGVPCRHRVTWFMVSGGWALQLESGLSLKKVIATLLFSDGHITCLAILALLPLITSNDLPNSFLRFFKFFVNRKYS